MPILSVIYTIMQVFLKAVGLWEQYQDYASVQMAKEIEERRQRLDQAIKDAEKAKTAEEAYRAQEDIVHNKP